MLNNPCLKQALIKLVVSKEEAEVAKVIAKATKRPVPVNLGSFTGQTRRGSISEAWHQLQPQTTFGEEVLGVW